MSHYDEIIYNQPNFKDNIRYGSSRYLAGEWDKAALHQLICVLAKSVLDERITADCTRITITLREDSHVHLEANDSGIPVEYDEKLGCSVLEYLATTPLDGGRITDFLIVSALSAPMIVEVMREGWLWRQEFAYGAVLSSLEQVRKVDSTGTGITIRPDFDVLKDVDFDYDALAIRLNALAGLTGGLQITLRDERTRYRQREDTFYYENGVSSFVEQLSRSYQPLCQPVCAEGEFDAVIPQETRKMHVAIGFQYCEAIVFNQLTYANLRRTHYRAVHLDGFLNGLLYMLTQLSGEPLKLSHIRDGLVSVVSVRHPDIDFIRGIMNPDIEAAAFDLTVGMVARFAEQYPDQMQRIIGKCLANKRARE